MEMETTVIFNLSMEELFTSDKETLVQVEEL